VALFCKGGKKFAAQISLLLNFKNACCVHRFSKPFKATFGWSLAVVDKWSLFRDDFSIIVARAGYSVVGFERWSLFGGGR